jgi:hypothetical protein
MGKLNRRETHWDRITKGGPDICFVCGKSIKSVPRTVYIGQHPILGFELRRHRKCNSLSPQWKRKFEGSSKSIFLGGNDPCPEGENKL